MFCREIEEIANLAATPAKAFTIAVASATNCAAAEGCSRGGKLCTNTDDAYSMILCLDGWYLTAATGTEAGDINYINYLAAAASDASPAGTDALGTMVGDDVHAGMECLGKNSLRLYIPYTLSLSYWLQDLSRRACPDC